MRIAHFEQIEIFFPIRSFFFERRIAKTSFDPRGDAGLVHASLTHVVQIFVTGDGTATERFLIDRADQLWFSPRLYFCFNEIAHEKS